VEYYKEKEENWKGLQEWVGMFGKKIGDTQSTTTANAGNE
jgi:hypothetical protein